MFKFRITKQYAQEFDAKCAKVNAHGFLRFLTEPDANNISLINLIDQVEDAITFEQSKLDRDIQLNEQNISNYMNEFFSKYMPQKAEQVRQILSNTHPYFIDSNGGTHVNFIPVKKEDNHSSCVGHRGRHSFLDFNVYIHNSLDDLRTTAHELGHALSSHHQHLIEMIRSNVPTQEIDKYTQKSFEKDCVCEIESHIIERLFNRFLIKKGLYTNEDLENYEKGQQASLFSEINLIREERDIIKNLPCPVSYESLDKLVKGLQKNNQSRLIDRVKKIHDEDKCSSYMFRYVVGRIVADQWIRGFENATNHQTRVEMLNKFQAYLDKTHKLDLDSACEDLLGQNFACVIEDYITTNNKKRFENEKSDEMSR